MHLLVFDKKHHKALLEMWLPYQQGEVYLSYFDFKTSPIYLGKVTKFQEKILCRFGVMLQKPPPV